MWLMARETVAVETFALLAISRMSIGMSEAERQLADGSTVISGSIRLPLPRETDQRKAMPREWELQVGCTLLN